MHEQDEAKSTPEERAAVLGALPRNAKLLIVGPGGKLVREIKRDADGNIDDPVDLEPGQGIAVVSVERVPGPPVSRWTRVHVLVVHVLAVVGVVYIAASLLPWPWWLTVIEAVAILAWLVLLARQRGELRRSESAADDEDDQREDREDHKQGE